MMNSVLKILLMYCFMGNIYKGLGDMEKYLLRIIFSL